MDKNQEKEQRNSVDRRLKADMRYEWVTGQMLSPGADFGERCQLNSLPGACWLWSRGEYHISHLAQFNPYLL